MDPERWRRIKFLFDEALERPPEGRHAFLQAACPEDPSLVQEVEDLLTADVEAGEFLAVPAAVLAPHLVDTGPDVADPEREALPPAAAGEGSAGSRVTCSLPGYRIVRRIGEGGMGVVYEAEQIAPIQRRVAVKVVRPGMDGGPILSRFASERQALALMNHANIAQVFDAGTTEQGLPFFAMEFVEGRPITAYCDAERLELSQRLALFVEVCRGVQHAHQKGIIHRDLKPSNILVTLDACRPRVKIIDFGIAKATGTGLGMATLETRQDQILGTPEYMSPEQIDRSEHDVDTRTDVYALGVLLYELLVGTRQFAHRPHRPSSLAETLRRIREEDPAPPGAALARLGAAAEPVAAARRTDARTLRRRLRGDLDGIALKATAKDRERRYASPEALAEDIERHARHLPVNARPPSAAYHAGRFVSRHRVGVAAAAVAVVAILGGAAAATVGMVRARRAEVRARDEAATAKQVTDFLVQLFRVSSPEQARGASITAREILDRGAADVEGSLASQPRLQVRLMSIIGSVYVQLGQPDAARGLLERAVARADAALTAADPELPLALNALANLAYAVDDYAIALPLYERAHALRETTLGPDHPDVATLLNNQANVLQMMGRLDDARPLLERALAIRQHALGPNDATVGESLGNLAYLHARRQDWARARELYQRAITTFEKTAGADHPHVALYVDLLGSTYFDAGDYREAQPLYERALAIREKVLGPSHPEVANSLFNLARTLVYLGENAKALPLLDRALRIYNGTLGPRHAYVADVLFAIGQARAGLGDRDQAVAAVREAVAITGSGQGLLDDPLFEPLRGDPGFRRLASTRPTDPAGAPR